MINPHESVTASQPKTDVSQVHVDHLFTCFFVFVALNFANEEFRARWKENSWPRLIISEAFPSDVVINIGCIGRLYMKCNVLSILRILPIVDVSIVHVLRWNPRWSYILKPKYFSSLKIIKQPLIFYLYLSFTIFPVFSARRYCSI